MYKLQTINYIQEKILNAAKGGSTSKPAHRKIGRQWLYLYEFYDRFQSIEQRTCSSCGEACVNPAETLVFGTDNGTKYEPCDNGSWDNGQIPG